MEHHNADRVYELPYDNGPKNYEYFLPAQNIPEDVRSTMPPFFRQMIGKDSDAVRELLRKQWSGLEHPSLVKLRELLLQFKPTSIVIVGDASLLVLERPVPPEYKRRYDWMRDLYVLAAPGQTPDLALRSGGSLPDFYDQETQLIRDFYTHFPGVRESLPVDTRWLYTGAMFKVLDDRIPGLGEWAPSIDIYDDLSGDGVQMKPTGEVGWYLHEFPEVRKFGNSFADFIDAYVAFREKYPFSFRAFPPRTEKEDKSNLQL